MEIKILCECGVKFKFDVEPRDGRSPGPVHCPGCHKDQTAATDEKIREQLPPAPAPAPAEEKKRISISVAAPAATPAGQVAAPAPPIAIPAVRIPTAGGGGAQVSPKMAVMAVPATAKALSVKPPGEAAEEHAAPSQVASTSNAPGSPKMAKMAVPTGGTALSVSGHAKKEEAPAAPQAAPVAVSPTPAPASMHPAAGRIAPASPTPKRGSGAGIGIVGAIVGAIVGSIAWYFIALNSAALGLLAVIPGIATGFLARAFARRPSQTVATASVVIGGIATAAMLFIVASAVTERRVDKIVALMYDARMELAKRAAEAKTDDQVRDLMIEDEDTSFEDAKDIPAETVANYRRKELAELQKFAKGEPGRSKFEQTERERFLGDEDNPFKYRIRWIGFLIWGFAGLSAAFKIAGGETKEK